MCVLNWLLFRFQPFLKGWSLSLSLFKSLRRPGLPSLYPFSPRKLNPNNKNNNNNNSYNKTKQPRAQSSLPTLSLGNPSPSLPPFKIPKMATMFPFQKTPSLSLVLMESRSLSLFPLPRPLLWSLLSLHPPPVGIIPSKSHITANQWLF